MKIQYLEAQDGQPGVSIAHREAEAVPRIGDKVTTVEDDHVLIYKVIDVIWKMTPADTVKVFLKLENKIKMT